MKIYMLLFLGFVFYSPASTAQKFKFEATLLGDSGLGSAQNYRFYGQRFPSSKLNSTNPSVIIAHGIFNSYGVTVKLAQYLQKHGFDVWVYNHPGFGQKGLVTKEVGRSLSNLQGDYGLMSIVQGVDAMVRYVTQQTQQPPIFVGYSLGGMALDLYLHGAKHISKSGELFLDSSLARVRQQSLHRAVYLGAPLFSFREMTRGLKIIFGASYCYTCFMPKKNKRILNLGLGNEQSRLASVVNWLSHWLPDSVWGLILKDVTHYKNMDAETRQNLGQYLVRQFSNIHSDLIHDLASLASKIEQSHLSSGLPDVNALYVVGTYDGLADHALIKKYLLNKQKINPHHQLLTVEQVGHLDLMEQYVIKNFYGPHLIRSLLNKEPILNQSNSCEDKLL